MSPLAITAGTERGITISLFLVFVVVTLGTIDLLDVTEQTAVNLTYIQPLDDNTIRALDSVSGCLMSLRLKYVAIPVRQSQ